MDMSIVESDNEVESDDDILEGSYFEKENTLFNPLVNLATPKKNGGYNSNFFSPMCVDGTPYRKTFLTDFNARGNEIARTTVSRLQYGEDPEERAVNQSRDNMIVESHDKSDICSDSFDIIDASLNENVNCSMKLNPGASYISKIPLSEISNNTESYFSSRDSVRNKSKSVIVIESSDEYISDDSFKDKIKNIKECSDVSVKSKLQLEASHSNSASLSAVDNNKESSNDESKSIIVLGSDDEISSFSSNDISSFKIVERNSGISTNRSLKRQHDVSESSNSSLSKSLNGNRESFSKNFVADEDDDSDCMEVDDAFSSSVILLDDVRTTSKERSFHDNKMFHMSYIEQQLKDKQFKPDLKSLGIVDYQLSFLSSLSDATYGMKCDPVAEFFKLHFGTAKTSLARHLYYIFNEIVFDNQLPKCMPLKWSNKLKTACGITTTKLEADPKGNAMYTAYITLSKKIITTAERLRDTLVHEMCHAAVWIVNHASDSHGSLWKMWALKARVTLPELPEISRCHTYEINYKYIYKCKDCGYRIGRSRPSDKLLNRCVCGYCGGKFRLYEDGEK